MIKFGIAFNEASGPCLTRADGNDAELQEAAIEIASSVAAGHFFAVVMRDAFPINALKAIQSTPEVCNIFCATANPVEVIVAETEQGRGVLGVIDGSFAKGRGNRRTRKEPARVSAQDRVQTMNRRTALKQAGAFVAAAGWASVRAAEQAPVSQVMTTLSTYMSGAAERALPENVVEAAKHHILDTFAAMISGADLPPGRIALQFARAHAGERIATVVGSDVLCGPIEAALANGMLAHSDETDDSHAPSQSHPGCAVVPAALAAGEQFGIDGNRFLRAVALGYDIGPAGHDDSGRPAISDGDASQLA